MTKLFKRILCGVLALCLCAGMAACGKGDSGAASGSGAAAGGHVDLLTVGTTSQIDTLSIMSQSGSFGKFNYNSIAYANLFYPDKNGEMQPYFLDSYEISADGCELRMTFPTTAVWHDGEPVTADDVVFTFEFRRDVMGSKALRNLVEIKKEADNAVTLVFSEPDAYYFVRNSNLTTFLIPQHIWENVEDYSAYAGEDARIGCGPYKLTNVDEDAGLLEFEAVPENAFLGELTVDKIVLKSYSSQDAMLMAMANGEIDLMYDYATPVSYTLLDVIAGNADVDAGESGYIGVNDVAFNTLREPNDDPAFREAAVKSLDWTLLAQVCNGEYGEIPGSGLLPSACAGYDDSLWTMYQDVDEANALLDAAGYLDVDGDGLRELPDGGKLSYQVAAQFASKKQELLNRIGEVLVASLRAVGIDAAFDQASLASSEANALMLNNGEFDLFIGYCTTGVATYRTAYWYLASREATGRTDILPSFNNEAFDGAYDKLLTATNNEEYLAAVGEMQKLASEQLFAFAVCWEKCFFPYRTDKYQGLENYPSIGVVHAETFYTLTTK